MDFIHQSVASDTPNDKQKSEAGCSYEDPYPGRLRRLLYLEQIIRNNIYFEDQWNIVSTVNLDCKLDLKAIALQARNAEYNPKHFAAVIMRIREPKTTASIFASGKRSLVFQLSSRLEGLAYSHGAFSSYELELFPGLIYRMKQPKIVLLIFVSGKIVLTEAKVRDETYTAFESIYPVFMEFRKNQQRFSGKRSQILFAKVRRWNTWQCSC